MDSTGGRFAVGMDINSQTQVIDLAILIDDVGDVGNFESETRPKNTALAPRIIAF